MADYDLVIRNGTIFDGSGSPPTEADVAISGGWIVARGDFAGRGAEEIEARGLLVTPGFVDPHTHYDGQAIWSDQLSPSSQHGVTTVVTGNCGIGFAPCRADDQQELIELMEGVEDIPGVVSSEGLTWDWETFPEYLTAVERRRRDIDIAMLVPHSPLRVYVMGERALRHEPATAEDCAAMRALLREGLEAGALGLGTSKLMAHRSSRGELIPSYSAEEREFIELASELRECGRGVFQMVTDVGYTTYEEQIPLLSRIAQAAGRPLTYTHPQSSDWANGIALLDEANRKPGVDIKAQLLPRPVGMMLGLSVSAHPFSRKPTYLRLKDLPLETRVREMRRPEIRAAILAEDFVEPINPLVGFTQRFDRLFVTAETVDYEPPFAQSIAAIARARGQTAQETAYDELLEERGAALLLLTLGNYEEGSLDWMEVALESPNVVLGLGDGGAHYGMICDASYSTFALSYWTRDRTRGRRTIEEMVHKLSREPALLMGLNDRGLIAPNHRAHLNVIDYDRLALSKPVVVADLPAGGRRLHQAARGYHATIVDGSIIVRDDAPTANRPGRLVRAGAPARRFDPQSSATAGFTGTAAELSKAQA
jgi:N-acyl-D-amino-acid deacylase